MDSSEEDKIKRCGEGDPWLTAWAYDIDSREGSSCQMLVRLDLG